MRKLLNAARKAGWNLGDQILSALSNVILTVVIARSVGSASIFGAFAIAFTVFGIGIAVTRAVVGQPLQIRYAASSEDEQRAAIGRAHGFAVLIGIVGGLLCIGVGAWFGGDLGTALIALGVCLPGLLLQDTQRLTFFALGKSWGAVVIDGVWNLVLFSVLAALILSGITSLGPLVLAWGGSAALAAGVGVWLLKVGPRLRGCTGWIRETRDLTGYLLAEYVLGLGASQVSILLVAVIASEEAVGSLRAAQTLLGPLGILGAACFSFTVPEIARRTHLTPQQRVLAGHAVSGLMGLAAAVYVGALLLLPDSAGEALFAESWGGASTVLLAMGASSVFSSLANGIAGVLYGLGHAKLTFRINMAKAPVILVAVLGGAWFGGALGAAIGMAVAEAYVLPLWYIAFRRAAKQGVAARPA